MNKELEALRSLQDLAFKAKRLSKNKDYRDVITNTLNANLNELINAVSSTKALSLDRGQTVLQGAEKAFFLQGKIGSIQGFLSILDSIILNADQQSERLAELEEEVELSEGQPVIDNQ